MVDNRKKLCDIIDIEIQLKAEMLTDQLALIEKQKQIRNDLSKSRKRIQEIQEIQRDLALEAIKVSADIETHLQSLYKNQEEINKTVSSLCELSDEMRGVFEHPASQVIHPILISD
jgi:ribosome-binding ATPase YchF (GTP1/OBG family)